MKTPLEDFSLPTAILEKIKDSEKCLDILSNKKLRELLQVIDSAKNKDELLENHLTNNDEFADIINTILVEIGIRDENGVSVL